MKCEIRTCHTSDGFDLKFRHYPADSQAADSKSFTEISPSHAAAHDGSTDNDASPTSAYPSHAKVGSQLERVVVAVHGIQSHSGWYRESSMAMANGGCHVYFADRRGSGLNGRDRGHADHGFRLLNDLKQLVLLAQKEHPNAPIALLGLSWGGKLATAFAATYPELIHRLILLYPATDSVVGPNLRQSLLLKMARHHDVRHKLVPLPFTEPAWFTNIKDFQLRIQNDPLALNAVTTGFLNATKDLDRIVKRDGPQISHPLLVMLAGADRIVDNLKIKRRIHQWATSELCVIEYPGAQHTLEFCSQRQAFFQDLTYWLNRSLFSDAIQVPKRSHQ